MHLSITRAGVAALLLASVSVLAHAGTPEITDTDDGALVVPTKRAPGQPVLVVLEFPQRYRTVVALIKDGLASRGVIVVAPKLKLLSAPVRIDYPDAQRKIDALVARAGQRPGPRTAMAFSGAGGFAYALGLHTPGRFAGLVVVASVPPRGLRSPAKGRTHPPALLIHGDQDAQFGPAQGRAANTALEAVGIKAALEILKGADHIGTLRGSPPVIARWLKRKR